jgi:hypothetical protein
MSKLGEYRKALTGVAAVAVTYLSTYYSHTHWVGIVVGVAGALGVYAVPNAPGEKTINALLPYVEQMFKDGKFDKYMPQPATLAPVQHSYASGYGGQGGSSLSSGQGSTAVGGAGGGGGGGGLVSPAGSGSANSGTASAPASPPLSDVAGVQAPDPTPVDPTVPPAA